MCIFLLISFKVMSPRTLQGLINPNGYTTEDAPFWGVCMYEFLPECIVSQE